MSNNDNDWQNRLENKLDRLDQRLDDVQITLTKNTDTLIVHEKRSDINEKNLDLLRQEFIPVKSHVTFVNHAFKLFSVVLSLLLAAKSLGVF